MEENIAKIKLSSKSINVIGPEIDFCRYGIEKRVHAQHTKIHHKRKLEGKNENIVFRIWTFEEKFK